MQLANKRAIKGLQAVLLRVPLGHLREASGACLATASDALALQHLVKVGAQEKRGDISRTFRQSIRRTRGTSPCRTSAVCRNPARRIQEAGRSPPTYGHNRNQARNPSLQIIAQLGSSSSSPAASRFNTSSRGDKRSPACNSLHITSSSIASTMRRFSAAAGFPSPGFPPSATGRKSALPPVKGGHVVRFKELEFRANLLQPPFGAPVFVKPRRRIG